MSEPKETDPLLSVARSSSQHYLSDASTGGCLTDGGAWTDVEALSALRRREHRATLLEDTARGSYKESQQIQSKDGSEPETPISTLLKRMNSPSVQAFLGEPEVRQIPSPVRQFAMLGLLGFAVEFVWASCEAVVLPHLTDHLKVPFHIASLIWLFNPIVGVFLQPLVGYGMDNWEPSRFGRRGVFIIAFGVGGVLGLTGLVFIEGITEVFGLPKVVLLGCIFFFFALADLSHDCLLIPGRVLIGDITQNMEESAMARETNPGVTYSSENAYENGHALFSIMQCFGRLFCDFIGMVPLWFTIDPYYRQLGSSLGVLGLCSGGAYLFTREPEAPTPELPEPERHDVELKHEMGRRFSTGQLRTHHQLRQLHERAKTHFKRYPVASTNVAMEGRHKRRRWAVPLPAVTVQDKPGKSSIWSLLDERGAVAMVLALTCGGWVLLCALTFYWTAWVGLEREVPGTKVSMCFASLAAQALVAVMTTVCLPNINSLFGELNVFLLAQAVGALVMILTHLWREPIAVLILGGAFGFFMGIHPNNSLTVCEKMVDNSDLRGSILALVNSTMPLAQIAVSLLSGPLIAFFGGDIAAYFSFLGVLHITLLGLCSILLFIEFLVD